MLWSRASHLNWALCVNGFLNRVRKIKMQFIWEVSDVEIDTLLPQWKWLLNPTGKPLYLTIMGDWLFGEVDGSISLLSVLDGTYETIASDFHEYNKMNKSQDWCDNVFLTSWYDLALEHGLQPKQDECLGWNLHPIIGGEFCMENLQVFTMKVYQSLMSQLHFQLQHANT